MARRSRPSSRPCGSATLPCADIIVMPGTGRDDTAHTDDTQLNVFATFEPKLPAAYVDAVARVLELVGRSIGLAAC